MYSVHTHTIQMAKNIALHYFYNIHKTFLCTLLNRFLYLLLSFFSLNIFLNKKSYGLWFIKRKDVHLFIILRPELRTKKKKILLNILNLQDL